MPLGAAKGPLKLKGDDSIIKKKKKKSKGIVATDTEETKPKVRTALLALANC